MTAYSNNGISTDVTVAIESVEDQQGDIFPTIRRHRV